MQILVEVLNKNKVERDRTTRVPEIKTFSLLERTVKFFKETQRLWCIVQLKKFLG